MTDYNRKETNEVSKLAEQKAIIQRIYCAEIISIRGNVVLDNN